MSGCLSFNFGNGNEGSKKSNSTDTNREIVLLANSNNVYRLSTESVLEVKVQNDKGKWVKSEHKVLIPEDWYIIDKDALN